MFKLVIKMIVINNNQQFHEIVQNVGDLLIVVDFFATWCGPCKDIVPKLNELSQRYSNKILMLKVDVDKCEELSEMYNIQSMPTFVFIKHGIMIDSFSGANADKLESYIQYYTN